MNQNCKICGAGTKEFFDRQLKINFYYCHQCQFIAQDEETLLSSAEEKAEYDLHTNSYEDEGYVNRFRRFLEQNGVERAKTGDNALDFGSGPEPVLAKVLSKEYGYEVDIYDLYYSPKKVYADKKYDLITCTEVVEHLKQPMQYFELLRELLKEQGILALMTQFHPGTEEGFCKWYYRREKSHISFFAPKTMKYIAEKLSLCVHFIDDKNSCSFRPR